MIFSKLELGIIRSGYFCTRCIIFVKFRKADFQFTCVKHNPSRINLICSQARLNLVSFTSSNINFGWFRSGCIWFNS